MARNDEGNRTMSLGYPDHPNSHFGQRTDQEASQRESVAYGFPEVDSGLSSEHLERKHLLKQTHFLLTFAADKQEAIFLRKSPFYSRPVPVQDFIILHRNRTGFVARKPPARKPGTYVD